MRDILGYEGLYAITSCGKVWSYRRQKFLKPQEKKNGYLQVILKNKGVQKGFLIHRLVAETYLPNPNNLPQVNHKDEDKIHNWISNLEWCDAKYNSNFGTRKERLSKKFGKRVYCEELDKIFDSTAEAARELNISRSHICEVCKGIHSHTHGYHFRYVEEEQ